MSGRDVRVPLWVSAGELAIVAIFGMGATTKLIDPRPAFEIAEAVTGSPWAAASVLILALVAETGLATATGLRLVRGRTALLAGIGTLLLFTGWLLIVRLHLGASARCQCLPGLPRGTVTTSMVANVVVTAELFLVVVLNRGVRRRIPVEPASRPPARGRHR